MSNEAADGLKSANDSHVKLPRFTRLWSCTVQYPQKVIIKALGVAMMLGPCLLFSLITKISLAVISRRVYRAQKSISTGPVVVHGKALELNVNHFPRAFPKAPFNKIGFVFPKFR